MRSRDKKSLDFSEVVRVLQGAFGEILLSTDLDRQGFGNVVDQRIGQPTEEKD